MKPEAQRIALAKACPKIIGLSSSGAWMWADSQGKWWACHNNDPLHDLNAMHEAEKALTNTEQKYDYFLYLNKLLVEGSEPSAVFIILHATALQRAEAFLRTIGKWEE